MPVCDAANVLVGLEQVGFVFEFFVHGRHRLLEFLDVYVVELHAEALAALGLGFFDSAAPGGFFELGRCLRRSVDGCLDICRQAGQNGAVDEQDVWTRVCTS
jgi:hypothetical protein